MKKTLKSNSYSQMLRLLAVFVIMFVFFISVNASNDENYTISKTFNLTQSQTPTTPSTPSYMLEIKNDIQISPTEFTFDIYIKNTSINPLWLISWEMQGFQAGIKINNEIVNGGVITPTIVNGYSDLLVSNQQTNANLSMQGFTSGIPTINYGLKMTAKAASLGSGTQILTSEMCICRIKLTNTVPFTVNSFTDLTWSFSLIPWQTKVSAFLPAATDITNQPDHLINNLTNPALNPQLNTPALPKLSANIISLNSAAYACGSVNPDISGNTISILNEGYIFPDTSTVGNCTDIEYLWEYSFDNLNWIAIGSFSNTSINFPGLTTYQNTYIHRLARISCLEPVNNTTQNISNSILLTVYPALSVSIGAQTNVSCFNGSNGALTALVNGGTTSFTYSWSKDDISFTGSTNVITGLAIGNYAVIVTDANNCTASISSVITQPSALQSNGIVTNTSCGITNGSIDLTTTGGTFPYNFLWSNSETTEDITNLSPSNYSVTITDFNGCVLTKGFDVNSTDCLPIAVNDSGIVTVNLIFSGSVQNNDIPSADGGNTWTLVGLNGGALNGTVNMDINGSYTYSPNLGFTGNDVFSYNLCDSDNDCSTGIVNIEVDSVLSICLKPKVLLQGPYDFNNHLMWDSLRVHNLIPINEPYSSFPYNQNFTHTGGGGGESILNPIAIFGVTGSNAIVDWVFIELRDKNNNKLVKHTRSALLQRDGDIVDVDGVSPICFQGLTDNQFYIVIRHRNHLGVMTANAKILTTQGIDVDFSNNLEPEFNFGTTHPIAGNSFNFTGLSQFTTMDGKRALWNGNSNGDHKVKYEAPNDDQSITLMDVFLNNGNSSFQSGYDFTVGYYSGDVDLNGKTKYEAPTDDQSIILLQVLIYPLNTSFQSAFDFMYEQIPF
jgi:hypothetical protein